MIQFIKRLWNKLKRRLGFRPSYRERTYQYIELMEGAATCQELKHIAADVIKDHRALKRKWHSLKDYSLNKEVWDYYRHRVKELYKEGGKK